MSVSADSSASSVFSATLPIPIDLFVSKKHPDCFVNSSGDTVFRIHHQSTESSLAKKRVLLDASGIPLISLLRSDKGSWLGFKGEDGGVIFRTKRTVNKLTKTEFEVFLAAENMEDSIPSMKMKGWPFRRSCTVYNGNAIVAQTSLMHKLHQVVARRGKFRLTLFPGSVDPVLVVALVVIFFNGRR